MIYRYIKHLILILAILFIFVMPAWSTQNLSGDSVAELKATFTGGATNLYHALAEGDIYFVFNSTTNSFTIYRFDATSAGVGDDDLIVTPAEISTGVPYAGDGRWIKTKLNSDGLIMSAGANPVLTLNSSDVPWYIGVDDTGNTLEIRTNSAVGTSVWLEGTEAGAWSATGSILPSLANGAALGSATKEWSNLYLADGGVIYFQNDQSVYLTPSSGLLTLTGGLATTTIVQTGTVNQPDTADGASLGDATHEWADLFLADGGRVYFQNDQSVYLTPSSGTLTLTGDFVTSGTIQGRTVYGADITGSTAHDTTECHNVLYHATAAATVTLDAAADAGFGSTVGYRIRDASEALLIETAAGEKINLAGTALATGTGITATGAGSYVILVATTDTDGSGTNGWETWGNSGFASE